MKRTRNILMVLYWLLLLVAAGIYVCGEFLEVDMAWLSSDESRQMGIVVQMVMILLTLGLVPLALYLFKMKRIHASLVENPSVTLLKWGVVRILILGSRRVEAAGALKDDERVYNDFLGKAFDGLFCG